MDQGVVAGPQLSEGRAGLAHGSLASPPHIGPIGLLALAGSLSDNCSPGVTENTSPGVSTAAPFDSLFSPPDFEVREVRDSMLLSLLSALIWVP